MITPLLVAVFSLPYGVADLRTVRWTDFR